MASQRVRPRSFGFAMQEGQPNCPGDGTGPAKAGPYDCYVSGRNLPFERAF